MRGNGAVQRLRRPALDLSIVPLEGLNLQLRTNDRSFFNTCHPYIPFCISRSSKMQRLGWSARTCRLRPLVHNFSRLCSFSAGSEHDDFWSAAKTEAKATPAYQQATQATPAADGGDQWPTPGGFGPGRMPLGEAYGPSSTSSEGNSGGAPPYIPSNPSHPEEYRQPEPCFDMQSSMHLSPVKQADVRKFKGTVLVDIRQFTKTPDGTTVPTKKGIALTIPQWRRLQEAMGEIDRKIEGA